MNISAIAIRRPVTTVMIFGAMVLLGLVSLQRIPLLLLPDASATRGMVMIWSRESRSIEDMERDLIVPVEGMIAQLEGVRRIDSFFRSGGSRIMLDFHEGENVKYRLIELEEKLTSFMKQFDRNAVGFRAFAFENSHLNSRFMELRLKGPTDDPHFTRIDVDNLEAMLTQIDGISAADAWGGTRRIVDVAVDQNRLSEFGVSLFQVINTVRNYANEPVILGELEEKGKRYFVRFNGQFVSSNEIQDVVVKPESSVAVRHLGVAEEKVRTRERIYTVDGKPAIGFSLMKEAHANPIEISNKVKGNLDYINSKLPPGYEFEIRNDQAEGVIALIRQLAVTALIGMLLSMIVLFIFIRDAKMTLVICVVIPICVISAFNGLYFANLTLNVVSLIGLAVGVGSLIDNSIVVMENIFRHYERGKKAVNAALQGTQEVGWAIMALTITGIIVFVPILFVPQQPPSRHETLSFTQVFQEGALSIILPICFSMLVALMLVPMASARILAFSELRGKRALAKKATHQPSRSLFSRWLEPFSMVAMRKRYMRVLKSCLRHRIRFLIAVVLLCSYTYFYSMNNVQRDVMAQPEDRTEIRLYVYLAQGTTQEFTIKTVDQITEMLREKVPEADSVSVRIEDDNANIYIELKPANERKRRSETIREELKPFIQGYPGAEISFYYRRPSGDSMTPPPVSGRSGDIEIRGPEYSQLLTIAESFSQMLMQIEDIQDAYSETESGPLEYQFHLDRESSALVQINARTVANAIQVAQRGNDFSSIQMKKGDTKVDIVFSQFDDPEDLLEENEQEGLKKEELYSIPVYSSSLRSTVKLDNLGVFKTKGVVGGVHRENRERMSRVVFDTLPQSDYREVERQIQELIDVYPLPAGYRMSLEGRGRQWQRGMDSINFILILGSLLIYMSLAALFESLIAPLVIMLSLPLAIVGVVWFLVITNTPFDPMMSGLGAIFLMGMLPNSAILMVYTTRSLRKKNGYNRNRAILTAGNTRLRPILMTVLTTVLGLMPLAISPQEMELWVPWRADINLEWMSFARVVIGGLISSTILTLIVVPAFYYIIDDTYLLCRKAIMKIGFVRKVVDYWTLVRASYSTEPLTVPEPVSVGLPVIQANNLTRIYATRSNGFMLRLKQFSKMFSPQMQPGFVPAQVTQAVNPVSATSTQDRVKALSGVTFSIESGIVGLLGPNGAGKTTLIRLLAGLDRPTRGSADICGFDVQRDAKKARKSVSYLPQYFDLYGKMTAWSYLDYIALLKGIKRGHPRRVAVDRVLEQVNLTEHAKQRVSGFSGGMKQRLGLAQMMLRPTPVIIVDEPTVSLDPVERIQFRNVLAQLGQDRVIIFSTHLVEDVAQCCGNLLLLQNGRIRYQGETDGLRKQAQNRVWEVLVQDEAEWHEWRNAHFIAGQKQTQDGILLRIIACQSPTETAIPLEPTLEDAYLFTIYQDVIG